MMLGGCFLEIFHQSNWFKGGGYTLRNVPRCWAYETGIALDADLPNGTFILVELKLKNLFRAAWEWIPWILWTWIQAAFPCQQHGEQKHEGIFRKNTVIQRKMTFFFLTIQFQLERRYLTISEDWSSGLVLSATTLMFEMNNRYRANFLNFSLGQGRN